LSWFFIDLQMFQATVSACAVQKAAIFSSGVLQQSPIA
jgi:hypothetical protein